MAQIFNSDFIEARLREHKAWQEREADRLAHNICRLMKKDTAKTLFQKQADLRLRHIPEFEAKR